MFSFVKFTLSLNVMLVKVTIDPDDTWLDDQWGFTRGRTRKER
jgi:hypothetical protein